MALVDHKDISIHEHHSNMVSKLQKLMNRGENNPDVSTEKKLSVSAYFSLFSHIRLNYPMITDDFLESLWQKANEELLEFKYGVTLKRDGVEAKEITVGLNEHSNIKLSITKSSSKIELIMSERGYRFTLDKSFLQNGIDFWYKNFTELDGSVRDITILFRNNKDGYGKLKKLYANNKSEYKQILHNFEIKKEDDCKDYKSKVSTHHNFLCYWTDEKKYICTCPRIKYSYCLLNCHRDGTDLRNVKISMWFMTYEHKQEILFALSKVEFLKQHV